MSEHGLEEFDVFELEASSAAANLSAEPEDVFSVICYSIVFSGIHFPVAIWGRIEDAVASLTIRAAKKSVGYVQDLLTCCSARTDELLSAIEISFVASAILIFQDTEMQGFTLMCSCTM